MVMSMLTATPQMTGSRDQAGRVALTRDQVMTASEVAELLHLPVSTVYYLARRGELPASRLGRTMTLLQSDISTSVIALWLGHEQETTTRGYLHGDLRLKQRALDRTAPPETRPGRYRATDRLLAFLDEL
jgi:excisionase family DNA binding protein